MKISDHIKFNDSSELQLVILGDGQILEVEHSFMYMLVKLITSKYNIDGITLADMCPYHNSVEMLAWLCHTADAILVTKTTVFMSTITEAQIVTLSELKDKGIYSGKIPYSSCN